MRSLRQRHMTPSFGTKMNNESQNFAFGKKKKKKRLSSKITFKHLQNPTCFTKVSKIRLKTSLASSILLKPTNIDIYVGIYY